MERQAVIKKLTDDADLDVLIIGAGINGIGTFRELALQGVDTLIVDRGDFCSGASAASSHMVHGGIRYLENGEFRLVREAVHERNRLIMNAPHLVYPLPTNIPIFKRFSGLLNAPLKFFGLLDRPAERGQLVIKLGLMMYDRYTREQANQVVPEHSVIGRSEALARYPKLNPEVRALATYYDGAMPMPERIAVETMLDAEKAHPGAHALNYVSAVDAEGDHVVLRDELTGETFSVRPRLVINAGGPWIDFINRALGQETEFIGGTKGSHLVLNHPELYAACGSHEFFFENDDGRIVLIYPVNDRVIIGTSDIKVDNPDNLGCTQEEEDYFIQFVGKIFPDIQIDSSHIVFRFCGVRPLPSSKAKTVGQISRDHSNEILEAGEAFDFPVFNLVGGKWTTFRAFSEHVADEALARLGVERQIDTHHLPIGGGHDYPRTASAREGWVANLAKTTGLDPHRATVLFERYGTYAAEIADYITAGSDRPLAAMPMFSTREIEFLADREKVCRLDDLLLRRTILGMYGHLSYPLIEEVAAIVGSVRGWEEATTRENVERTVDLLAARHGVHLAAPEAGD